MERKVCFVQRDGESREWEERVEHCVLLRRHDETKSRCSIEANGIILSLIVLSAEEDRHFTEKGLRAHIWFILKYTLKRETEKGITKKKKEDN